MDAVRTSCRQRLESCELWLRRLVHDKLQAEYGDDYLNVAMLSGQNLFKKEIRERVSNLIAADPKRYSRPADALLLDDLMSILCKEDAYAKFFSECMRSGFPAGREQLRAVLNHLIPIRNALSHANPLSIHDAERVLCYCNDIIDTLTRYYAEIGMSQEYDAPSFTRFSDSLGNVNQPASTEVILDFRNKPLRPGVVLRLEVEVDAHYDPSEYSVKWTVYARGSEETTGASLILPLEPKHVGELLAIMAQAISNKEWHRYGYYDAQIQIMYRVLPPV
jgi:hypothetical protein